MTIRHSEETDIPAIVDLLKLSLGESLMPKSEAFWRWKHIDNPFGSSPVLLAFDGDQLVGVRAFMRWEWRHGDKIVKSVRAVDTATHPQFQGKGIFKKLTLALVDECQSEGVHFIFNTPNELSKPGYIRMGWKEFRKLSIKFRLVMPINFNKNLSPGGEVREFSSEEFIKKNLFLFSKECLTTNRTAEFLTWRYANNPNVKYFIYSKENKSSWVIFRIKASIIGNEFRICEWFVNESDNLEKFWKEIIDIAKERSARVITYAGSSFTMPTFSLPVGPMITLKPLIYGALDLAIWEPTLGDMEVF